jgi:hypothetical protein
MTVLRELVAKLGFQVDDAGFKRAADGVDKIKAGLDHADAKLKGARAGFTGAGNAASALGTHAHAAGAGLEHAGKGMGHAAEEGSKLTESLIGLVEAVAFEETIRKMLELADETVHTKAVLDTMFGEEGAKKVEGWAENMGEYLGRSKHDLAAAAGGIGSLIQPMVGSAEKAEEMSTKLTELGVDLASFFGTSDEEAIEGLKSGMMGMGRSLKRYGIVLDETTLQEYAHKEGIAKKVSEMNQAEKAELTYGFLIAKTAKFQGNAHKTADEFSNATKRLKGNIKDLGVDIGKTLLPAASKLIAGFTTLVKRFAEVAAKSYIVQTTLAVLTAGFIAMKWEAIAALAAPLLSILAIAAALDELYTLFTGGKTVIGDWLDDTFGDGTTDKVVNGIKDAARAMKDWVDNMPDFQGAFELLEGQLENVGRAVDRFITKWTNIPSMEIDAKGNIHWAASGAATRGVGGKELSLTEQIVQDRNDLADRVRAGVEARAQQRKTRDIRRGQYRDPATAGGDPGAALTAPRFAPGEAGFGVMLQPDDSQEIRHGQARMRVPESGGGQHVTNITVNQGPVNVHGSANSPNDVRRLHEAERRKTREAIKHGGA